MQPEKLGPFYIGRVLGRGGMGAVYEGIHEQTGDVAAVKVLLDNFEGENDTRLRFEAEIDTLKRLRHPNIVRLFGFGKDQGLLYYVMELVEGASLYTELKRKRFFYWYEVAKIGMEICLALRHAHDRGITHRDVKPANILLEKNGTVKLSDFGIASLFGSRRLTDVNAVVGTLEFMSPEQALASPVGPRSDMYSLGAVLYALILNKPPFPAKHLAEIIKKHQENIIEPIRLTRIDVPDEMETIILNLLQIQPETRPQSPFAVARRFQTILQTQFSQYEQIIIRPTDNTATTNQPQNDVIDLNVVTPNGNFLQNNNSSLADSFGKPASDDVDITKSLTNVELSNSKSEINSTQFEFDHPPNISLPASNNAGENDINRYKHKTNNVVNCKPQPENELLAADPATGLNKTKTNNTRHIQHSTFTEVNEHELGSLSNLQTMSKYSISLQTIFASVSLLLIGGMIYYLLQPVPPDKLYERISSKLRSKGEEGDFSIESLRRAESEIRYFLDHHADHPRIGQVRIYEEQLNLANLERRLERRRQISDPAAISQVERAYLEATSWIKSDPTKAIIKLKAIIDLFGNDVVPLQTETETNLSNNKNENDNITTNKPKQIINKISNHRLQSPTEMCVELARRRLRELEKGIETINADQEAFLKKRIQDAKKLIDTEPEQARKLLSGIIELYGNQNWAIEHVNESQNLLKNFPEHHTNNNKQK
ncbi:MAG: serine/threonine protein kinase [Planctomycetaceae bacterium]|jgi:serine/threonine-protein kinase|nr:serine/threonine protein kinase [Planctomycetaceae bacterium]